jgi:hypothetical protein
MRLQIVDKSPHSGEGGFTGKEETLKSPLRGEQIHFPEFAGPGWCLARAYKRS